MARPPGYNNNRNRYPQLLRRHSDFYSSFHLTPKQHHGYCWKQDISCLVAKYMEASSLHRRKSVSGRGFIPMEQGFPSKLYSQQDLTWWWEMAMSLFQTSQLPFEEGGVSVITRVLSCPGSVNHQSGAGGHGTYRDSYKCLRRHLGCWGHSYTYVLIQCCSQKKECCHHPYMIIFCAVLLPFLSTTFPPASRETDWVCMATYRWQPETRFSSSISCIS